MARFVVQVCTFSEAPSSGNGTKYGIQQPLSDHVHVHAACNADS